MKTYVFIIWLFLYLNTTMAQNGQYIPFPSKMIVYAYQSRAGSDKGWYSSSRFEIEGDTIINGLQYSKYFFAESNRWGSTDWPTTDLKGLNKLMGGIRNDIPAKKVYLYSFSTKTEELLYDFDLHVGDTLFKNDGYKFYHSLLGDESYNIDTVWVSRIDSVLMPYDNLYHKRFNFKTKFRVSASTPYATITSDSVFGGPSWGFSLKINPLIEGVGPDFNPVSIYGEFEYGYANRLFCRSINKKLVYSDTGSTPPPFMWKANCNSIITGMDEKEESTFVTLYPNPSTGRFQLEVSAATDRFFEIYNRLGQKILEAKIKQQVTGIDLSAMPKGIYFIRIFDLAGNSEIQKLSIH